MEAYEASSPVNIVFGAVVSVAPLKIKLEQKLTLEKANLILTQSIPALSVNDKVVLIRMQGGQKYLIIDRVVT